MQTKVVRLSQSSKPLGDPSVLTIGNFDGLHIGHMALLDRLKLEQSRNGNYKSIVQSLYPHPAHVINPQIIVRPILSIRQKLGILSNLGIDCLTLVHFTKQVAAMGAKEFMDDFWLRICNVKHVVLGSDAALGRGREGDLSFIQKYCQENGIGLSVVDFVTANQKKISSREIRRAVSEGRFNDAFAALGRHFSIEGRVVGGDRRGRKIGFPTANIFTRDSLLPQNGVYAAKAKLKNQEYDTVVNIGIRPTFGGESQVTEAHLLNYVGPAFYGERIEIFFVGSIRKEQKFNSVEALKSQIVKDIALAEEMLKK